MKKQYLLAVLVLGLSQASFAIAGQFSLTMPGEAQCADCPAKPTSVLGPSFEKLAQIFEGAKKIGISTHDLTQDYWKLTTSKQISPVFFTNREDEDRYNPEGLSNLDGTLFYLDFNVLKNEQDQDQLAVELKNLGMENANQGPFEVKITDKKACFSQYAYRSDDRLSEDAYFTQECRFTSVNKTNLICAIIAKGKLTNPMQASRVGEVVAYRVYSPIRD